MQNPITVLKRPGGSWDWISEQAKLTDAELTICAHPAHPEFTLIYGEHDKQSIAAILGTDDFEVTVRSGIDNPDLPFRPSI